MKLHQHLTYINPFLMHKFSKVLKVSYIDRVNSFINPIKNSEVNEKRVKLAAVQRLINLLLLQAERLIANYFSLASKFS
jgi:hypothetical protein